MVIRLDRFTKALLALLVVGVYCLLLSSVFQGQPVMAQGNTNLATWEYTWTVNEQRDDGKSMNQAGKLGWEMVAAASTNNNSIQYYKRRTN